MTGTAKRRVAPGPQGHPILGSLPDFRNDNIRAFMNGWRQFGDVVRFRGRGSMFLVVHPDHVKHVLLDRHRNYPRPPFVDDKLKGVVGDGLVASEGELWLRQRRLAQPIFHRQRIAAFGTSMTDTIAEMLDRWQVPARRGEALDLRVEMQALTLSILAKALFAADWEQQAEAVGPAVTVALEHTNRRLLSVIDIPERVPVPANRRWLEARRTLDEIVYRLIAERRRSKEEGGDLVTMLLQARDQDSGEGMSDRQVRDEVMGFLIAGHETVSTGLTWTWYFLSTHPAVAHRLRAELAEVLSGRVPTVEDIPQLPYTTMVLEEAMRHYPPIWVMLRNPLEDDEIGGYSIPAGTFVILCPYVTHRHPDFWENAEGFDPERFTPERTTGRHRYAYFPFGGGPRKCIGESFGMMEMQLVIAMVAQRYRLDLVPGHPIAAQPAISLRARYGMLMTLRDLQTAPDGS
jgi:cytochrome P450